MTLFRKMLLATAAVIGTVLALEFVLTPLVWLFVATTVVLLILVGLLGFVLRFALARLAFRLFGNQIAWWQERKLLRVAKDVGVDSLELAHQDGADDLHLLVQRNIAQEAKLLWWKALRTAEHAGASAPIIEELERYRIANDATNAGVSFVGLTIPETSPLMRYDPVGMLAFNKRMRELKVHWKWTSDWLWQYRKTVKTPE